MAKLYIYAAIALFLIGLGTTAVVLFTHAIHTADTATHEAHAARVVTQQTGAQGHLNTDAIHAGDHVQQHTQEARDAADVGRAQIEDAADADAAYARYTDAAIGLRNAAASAHRGALDDYRASLPDDANGTAAGTHSG